LSTHAARFFVGRLRPKARRTCSPVAVGLFWGYFRREALLLQEIGSSVARFEEGALGRELGDEEVLLTNARYRVTAVEVELAPEGTGDEDVVVSIKCGCIVPWVVNVGA